MAGAGLVDLKAAEAPLRARVLALNARHARETGPLDAAGLDRLIAAAAVAPARADGRAFALALGPEAAHASPNFQWVRARFERFLYVDRIVVAAGLRGRGVGRALYGAVFAAARAAGAPRVVCEVNRVPPNPGSEAFHAALGFAEVGRGRPAPGKEVVYLARSA